jgi:hypothetical protein
VASWISLKCLLWINLYLISVVLVPWAISRSWAHQHGSALQPRPKQLFERGELGLVSLVLVCSVIWDLLQSNFMPQTTALGSILLASTGIMAATVWVETYCRRQSGEDFNPQRAWRDSRNLALMVFSMTAVIEVLLDRLAQVVRQ